MPKRPIAVFVKDEVERTAYTPAEVVHLRLNGWRPVEEQPASAAPEVDDVEIELGDPAGPPPLVGNGSGRDEWAGYADRHNVPVTDDMKRKDILAALDAAGVPTK